MLRLRKPWGSQPQEVTPLDRDNPLSQGLLIAWNSAVPTYNAATEQNNFTLIGSPTQIPTAHGLALNLTGTQNVNTGLKLTANTGTIVVLGVDMSLSGTVAGQYNDGATDSSSLGAGGYFRLGTKIAYFGWGATTGRVQIAGSWDSASIIAYADGRVDSAATPTLPPASATGAYYFNIGGGQYSGGYFSRSTGKFLQALVYDRVLSASELLSLRNAPWQIFRSRSIWVPVSAGGGANGNASAAPASTTLTTPAATGSGSAQASTAPAGSTLTAPTATASASAQASGALAGASLTAPTATATGTAAGHATATGAPAAVTLTAPTATATGSALASGALAGTTMTAPTGTASSAGHAVASGALAGVTMTAPTATATGSAQAFASFMATVLTAPTGTASNGETTTFVPNSRTHLVPVQNRTHTITPERRTRTVPRQTRTYTE